MSKNILLLNELPNFYSWIISQKWRNQFGTHALKRNTLNLVSRNLGEIEVSIDPAGKIGTLRAMSQGNAPKPYRTEIIFKLLDEKWDVDPDCSCAMGRFCEHAAGLMQFTTSFLTHYKNLSEKLIDDKNQINDNSLIEWLKKIEYAAQHADLIKFKPNDKSDNRFLAYCIEGSLHRNIKDLHFVLRVGTRQIDGEIKISESRSLADISNPPKYMVEEDFPVASLYHRRKGKRYSLDDMPLAGEGWDSLLEAAHATGRLYWVGNAGERNAVKNYLPVTMGQPETVNAIWKVLPCGSAKPELECTNPSLIIIPTQPLRYIDPVTATLGPVVSSLPNSILVTWQSGPTVSSGDLTTIAERFSTISTTQLPVPIEVVTEKREATPPLPHLHVFSRTVGKNWQQITIIVGQLSFAYQGSRLLPPLYKGDSQSHAEIHNGKRIIWPRDYDIEQILIGQLEDVGFTFLSEVFSPQALDDAAHDSVMLEDSFPTEKAAWLEMINSPEMQALEGSGWTIEVDPDLGLTTHNAVEFFPVIESDTAHGIDWFRFDITFELHGKQVSLIPILASAIQMDLPTADAQNIPEFFVLPCEDPKDGFIRFPARRLIEIVDQVRHLFHGKSPKGPLRIDRLAAAGVAAGLSIDSSETHRALAKLGQRLKNITTLPTVKIPRNFLAQLRPYQLDGYRWLQFLAEHGLNGILADDMGLGKTVQTLAHLAAEQIKKPGLPSLVISPTSVVSNWSDEAAKFAPNLKVLVLSGQNRTNNFSKIKNADIVLTSYPLLTRDFENLVCQRWHVIVLDEAQYIKNPKSVSAINACNLQAAHRLCLSGTPMENHLGELWSLMRFLMPGYLSDEKSFNIQFRRSIERDRSSDAQLALNRRISPLILRRTKDEVATELPEKTEIIHGIQLTKQQSDLYESVRSAMDKRVRDAISTKGLGQSHIIVLDALLKLRQICCHPQLLKSPAAQKITQSAKLDFLTDELLPTLLEEGRKILLFSSFTSMLSLIEKHLIQQDIAYLKLTGQTKDRAELVKKFQTGAVPIFLISLKAGGTGLNLTAADTVIHYDPWWNPAAENQATDRAHRIGQNKAIFVHKLVCKGTIEDRILDLQKHKSDLVKALLSAETSKLKIDTETLSHLLSPLD
ncbi:MAG: DEAD/DEAH box helicase [Akkermansiaceae bacterium]|nr:DEAD/DEAH box helicase [Akkermansiaceae bacterium]